MSDHQPITEEHREHMNELARMLDQYFNADVKPKRIGFALLVYNFGEDISGTGRVNYIGNGARPDVLIALKELIARWEGRVSEPEGKQ